jgi:predicted phage replisome organizer
MTTKKYYWIKLKTNFFNSEQIDFLMSQKNGCQYVVLYQMLCLNTANTNGEMASRVGEMIVPYDINKIVRDTKYFDFDTVVVALDLFKKLGLVYEEENSILKISNFEEMVGSESAWAEKKRLYRDKQKQLLLGQGEDNVLDNVREEKEIRDKSIEIDIDKDINKKKNIKTTKYFDDENLNSLFIEFLEVRKKLKAVNSDRAINTLINTLNNYPDDIKYKMIENSIVNSWKSVYELKPTNQFTKQPTRKEVVPDWLDKRQQKEEASPEEIKELEDAFADFKEDDWRKEAERLQQELNEKY